MRLNSRRVTVGLVSTAVVIGMTSVSTWALADTGSNAAQPPVHLIVGYRLGANPATAVQTMSAMGAARTATGPGQQALDALHATTVQVPAARSASLINSLRMNPDVEYVEVDHVRKVAETTPNDPVYARNLQPELREVNLPKTWDRTTGSAIKVAVLDTGVNPVGDLTGAVAAGYNFVSNNTNARDDYGHGTTVASLIGARGNNDQGMAGVCWSCQIVPVKVLDSTGSGYDSAIAKGIIWAVSNGAKIINMSLGGAAYSAVLADAVAYANANSVLVVAAAGNGNTNVKSYPAAYGDVVAVGATNRCPNFANDPTCTTGTLQRAPFSNFNQGTNKWVDVAAPGIVTAMDSDGNYNTGEPGTSFSAPIVSGIAALVKSVHPEFTGWSLMNAIQSGEANERPM